MPNHDLKEQILKCVGRGFKGQPGMSGAQHTQYDISLPGTRAVDHNILIISGWVVSLTCSGFQLVKEKSCRDGQIELFSCERCSPAGRDMAKCIKTEEPENILRSYKNSGT